MLAWNGCGYLKELSPRFITVPLTRNTSCETTILISDHSHVEKTKCMNSSENSQQSKQFYSICTEIKLNTKPLVIGHDICLVSSSNSTRWEKPPSFVTKRHYLFDQLRRKTDRFDSPLRIMEQSYVSSLIQTSLKLTVIKEESVKANSPNASGL